MTAVNYIEAPDIPEGLTIVEWRARRSAARRGGRVRAVRGLRRRLRAVAVGGTVATSPGP